MTYIRTILPEPDVLRKMIAEQGEVTIFKRYKKYECLQGSAESTKIINEILYKHYNKKKPIKQ